MLLRHTAIYSLSRGLAGMMNIAAIMLFTRLLSPAEYGAYALTMTMIGLMNSLVFHSIRMSLLRHYEREEDTVSFLSTIFVWFQLFFGVVAAVVLALSLGSAWMAEYRSLWWTGLIYLWLLAWFELNLTVYRVRLEPSKYGALFMAKHLLALGLGSSLVLLGQGVQGLLTGMVVGTAAAILVSSYTQWHKVRIRAVNPSLMKQLWRYGLPLTVTFTMGYLIHGSGRLLLGWFGAIEEAGLYAVAYDITQQSIILLMTVINLAAFPIVLKKLEQQDEAAARAQLQRNATLLLLIAVPATAGMIVLGPAIADVFLGREFRSSAQAIFPIVAVAAFLQGIKLFYFDLSFQLARKTNAQMIPVVLSVIVNVALNVWWIPLWGIIGSAYAALAAYMVGLGSSCYIGNKVFRLPLPMKDLVKIAAATCVMALMLLPVRASSGFFILLLQIGYGALVYFAAVWVIGVGGVRTLSARVLSTLRFHRKSKEEAG